MVGLAIALGPFDTSGHAFDAQSHGISSALDRVEYTVDKAALAVRAGQFNATQSVEVRYSSQAAQ
jgi:hypothetical protein